MTRIVQPAVCDPQSDESLDTFIELAKTGSAWWEQNARDFLDKIDRILVAGTWPRRVEGHPKTWARFCHQVLGYDAAYIDCMRAAIWTLQERGRHSATLEDALSPAQAAERVALVEGRQTHSP